MSAILEKQVIKKVEGLSDENLIFLSDMIDRFMKPRKNQEANTKRIGIAKGKFVVPDNIDECNDEIACMFGADK